jgi:hypothetical protein
MGGGERVQRLHETLPLFVRFWLKEFPISVLAAVQGGPTAMRRATDDGLTSSQGLRDD